MAFCNLRAKKELQYCWYRSLFFKGNTNELFVIAESKKAMVCEKVISDLYSHKIQNYQNF